MKKLKRVCAVILFFTIFQLNSVDAKLINTKNLNYVDICIDGQVSIDTQINGVSQDYRKINIDISEILVEIEENNQKKIYTNFIDQTKQGNTKKEYHKEVDSFSENAIITVTGRIKFDELNINRIFSKTYSEETLLEAMEEYPLQSGCNIKITSEELKKIITYDVIFKIEDGGKFDDDQKYIEHVNLLSGDMFPNLPEVISDENYKFLGWYNEETGLKIDELPDIVTEDLIAIAKLEPIKQNSEIIETSVTTISDDNNTVAVNNSGLETLDSYNPPKTAVENNIVLLIVSFIISLTVTIDLGYKVKKNKQ